MIGKRETGIGPLKWEVRQLIQIHSGHFVNLMGGLNTLNVNCERIYFKYTVLVCRPF